MKKGVNISNQNNKFALILIGISMYIIYCVFFMFVSFLSPNEHFRKLLSLYSYPESTTCILFLFVSHIPLDVMKYRIMIIIIVIYFNFSIIYINENSNK